MKKSEDAPDSELRAIWLGNVDYVSSVELQRSMVEARKSGLLPDSILLLEHPHIFTLGRKADKSHVLSGKSTLRMFGIEVHETDRGGEVTYHGPGQLVGYPIIDVRAADLGPVTYVRLLEKSIIQTLAEFGVTAHLVDGETGVWVGGVPNEKRRSGINPLGRKIAAIGVRITDGISMHGFALNISSDMSYYQHIVPCGMPNLPVTSVHMETGKSLHVQDCATVAATRLSVNLERELKLYDHIELPVSISP